MPKKHLFLILAAAVLIVPTLVNLSAFYTGNAKIADKTVFRMPLVGFDPRDFARGRYADLQINWKIDAEDPVCNDSKPLDEKPHPCGLCLIRLNELKTQMIFTTRDKLKQQSCDLILPDFALRTDNPSWKPIRFYLDERLADRVDEALRGRQHQFSADVVFHPDGAPVLRELYIDDIPHKTFLEGR